MFIANLINKWLVKFGSQFSQKTNISGSTWSKKSLDTGKYFLNQGSVCWEYFTDASSILQAWPRGVVGYQYTSFLPPGIPIYPKMQKRWEQIPKIIVIQNTLYLKILAQNTEYLGKKHPRHHIPQTPGRAWGPFLETQYCTIFSNSYTTFIDFESQILIFIISWSILLSLRQ